MHLLHNTSILARARRRVGKRSKAIPSPPPPVGIPKCLTDLARGMAHWCVDMGTWDRMGVPAPLLCVPRPRAETTRLPPEPGEQGARPHTGQARPEIRTVDKQSVLYQYIGTSLTDQDEEERLPLPGLLERVPSLGLFFCFLFSPLFPDLWETPCQ